MRTVLQDLRYAFRSLRKSPGFTAAALLTLGLGIGANVAIFSVVNAVLLRPLPYPSAERLMMVWGRHPQIGREAASLPDFLDWRAQAASFEDLAALDPDLALSDVRTMDQRIADATARPRISTVVLVSFAIVALLLAAIGIYGVISYGVAQRTRELGIRLALGAASGSVLGLVLRQGMVPVGAGIATGVVAAWAGTRLLRSLLFQTGATDAITFVAVALFLAGTALAACYLPARRAARSDPMAALRAD